MTITLIFGLSIFIFAVAYAIGWWRYASPFWNWVDLIYYPLAAIGVILLFISNDVQRDLLEKRELAEEKKVSLEQLNSAKPKVDIHNDETLLSGGLEHIALIAKWAELCKAGPSASDAKCLAVKDLAPHVQEFLDVGHKNFANYEQRLLVTCTAGEKMLENIRTSQAISSLVIDKLLAKYTQAVSLQLSPWAYDSIQRIAKEFKDDASSYAKQIHNLAFKNDGASGQLLLDIRMEEIEYGEMLLLGLSQCVSSPKNELSLLEKWSTAKKTQEQELTRLEAEYKELKLATTSHTTSLKIQLKWWPLMLVLGLALKFAKGAASLRKGTPVKKRPDSNM